MPESALFSSDDLTVLVERRRRLGDFLLGLWKVGAEIDELSHPQSTLFHLLLGAGFSLWRAAFLVEGEREREAMNAKAVAFLGRLVWDNAIGYPQDKDNRAWTAGYYLNNACYRLCEIELLFPDAAAQEELAAVRSFVAAQRLGGEEVPDLGSGWDQAFSCAEKLLHELESYLQA